MTDILGLHVAEGIIAGQREICQALLGFPDSNQGKGIAHILNKVYFISHAQEAMYSMLYPLDLWIYPPKF